jgi:hypothetical protein
MSSYVTAVSLPTKHMHMSRAKAIALPTVKNGKVRRPDRSEMRDQHNTKVYHLVVCTVRLAIGCSVRCVMCCQFPMLDDHSSMFW